MIEKTFFESAAVLGANSGLRKAVEPFSADLDVRSILDAVLIDSNNELDAVLKIDLACADLEKELKARLEVLKKFRAKLEPFVERAMDSRGSVDRSWYKKALEE